MIDLHTHSSASDGSLSPDALVRMAHGQKLHALALTDHDTISGLAEAAQTARELGIRFIRGVEIEIDFKPGEFHLLGLDLGTASGKMEFALERLSLAREERNRRIVERLGDEGIPIDYDALKASIGTGSIGRPHIAQYLVEMKVVKTKQLAFDRYLGKGKPFYESKATLELPEALCLIRESGGLSFIAHPLSLFVSWARLKSLFAEWKELGVDGIEAWHPMIKKGECERLERLAREFGFRVSSGSDFHGPVRSDRKLGWTAGNTRIDDAYLACLER